MRHIGSNLALLALLFTGQASIAAAPDKSGVKPSTLSLPSGAGSIEGLGESFEPQLNTGSSSYGVAIAMPPGRAGLQPKIRLAYNSSLGNSFVGLGWSLDFPSIKRQTDKGFPTYTPQDVFLSSGEELVPLSNPEGDWRCENESSFQRFRQIDTDGDFAPDAWEMTERNGTRHVFGQFRGQGGRWSVVVHPNLPVGGRTDFDRTYCWALNTTIDLHGNRIEYEYLPPNGDADSSGILYPSRITYSHLGDNSHEARFRYENRPDKFDDYRPTFSVTIGKRLVGIEVHSFYDGADHLVRDYALEYAYRPEDGITPPAGVLDLGVSTLKRFVQRDRSGNPANFLPPLLFEYSEMNLDFAQLHRITPPELDLAESSGNVQIADVDGDSLPDLIKTADSISGEQIVCMNRGEFSLAPGAPTELRFSPATIVVPFSSNFRLSNPNSTLTDIDGDGLTDFVRIDEGDITGKQIYTFANNSRLDGRGTVGFASDPHIQFSAPRGISFNNPAMRQMDVNFDKQSDFLRFDQGFISSFYYYFRDRDSGAWSELGPVSVNPDMIGYTLSLATNGASNPRVHLADMNGDRLQDLVYLESSGGGIGATLTVRYWPYCALGQWGAMRVMTPAPGDAFQVDTLDLRDVLVQDVTGDGLADIAILRSDGGSSSWLALRVNVAGRKWSAPFTKFGLPRHLPRDPFAPTVFRQADLNANGSTDLIWRNRASLEDSFEWLELLPDGKPNLLTRIDNSLGKRTVITYGNAVDDMVRARETGYPWQTWCPFPMQVVRRIRTTCGFDLDGVTDPFDSTTDQYVSEFHYRDAFYDGFEREFRGFAFAERIDYGDDFLIDSNLTTMIPSSGWDISKTPTGKVSGPTLVTRFRYLTGAGDGADNDDYPSGWSGIPQVDEVTPKGGREEEILKGRQIWEEKIDGWVMHDLSGRGDFDRGCYLALHSTNRPDRLRMTPDDFVYSRTRQDWAVRRLYRPNDPALAPPGRFGAASPSVRVLEGQGGSGRSVSYGFVASMTNEIIEANGLLTAALGYPSREPVVTAKSSDYDDYGNQTIQRDYGVVSHPGYDDERFTVTQYALGGEALAHWIIDKPSQVRITDENGVFVAETKNYYDGNPFAGLALGQIGGRALLHRVEQVVTGPSALPAITGQSDRPGDPRLSAGTVIQKARSEYDAFGNSIVSLDPLGDPGNIAAGHARRVDYDAVFRTHPIRETIMVGGGSANLVMFVNYDLGFGVVTNSVDFNNNVTTYEYDSFARLVAMVKPYDSSAFPTAIYQYLPADPNRSRVYSYDRRGNLAIGSSGSFRASSRVVTRQREQAGQPGVHVTVSYTDGCGRKLAEVKEAEVGGQWIVSGAQFYNRRMAAQATWLPYDITYGSNDSTPPHFGELWPAGRPPVSSLNNYPTVKTDKRFDATGREIVAINPPETLAGVGNESARTRSVTQLLPLEKRLFDENDNDPASPHANTPMVEFTDGLNRLIRVHEVVRLNDDGTPSGASTEWRTHYRYDLNDKLVSIRDGQNNEKWFRYDGLGRKLFMNDPDRGVMLYTYDAASNLRESSDAKSQRITYTYDGVNRVRTEDHHDNNPRLPAFNPQLPVSPENRPGVAYFYDVPQSNLDQGDNTTAAGQNTKGVLAYVWDLSGEEHTSYDARGRVEWVVKRIPDPVFFSTLNPEPSTPLVSYKTSFAYDSLDRNTTLIYPDNDVITYEYSARNLLKRIPGGPNTNVISAISYFPSGQQRQIDYGNGVRTTYRYDPRLRLTDLLTKGPPAQGGADLINFGYEFDGANNMTAIHDLRPASAAPAGDKRRNTQVFDYDHLYRLTRAQYSFNLPGEPLRNDGEINCHYDRIGNMLTQTSTISQQENGLSVANLGEMESGGAAGRWNRTGRGVNDPPGPHALSQIRNSEFGIRNYQYDPNGNMTLIDGLTNTWDFKDRLVAAENDWMRAAYTYDYTGRRVLKRIWQKATSTSSLPLNSPPSTSVLYPDKNFEVREGDAPTKYVWNGNTRVARTTGSLASNPRIQRLRLFPGWNLLALSVNDADAYARLTQGRAPPRLLKWDPGTRLFLVANSGIVLDAGSIVWLHSDAASIVSLKGNTAALPQILLPVGGAFLPRYSLAAEDLEVALPGDLPSWRFAAANMQWKVQLPWETPLMSASPFILSVGETVFVQSPQPVFVNTNSGGPSLRFYHDDHLQSTSVITDGTGALIEQTAYFLSGAIRSRHTSGRAAEPYDFTQTEHDVETSLRCAGMRFLAPAIGRFLSVDPLAPGSDLNRFRSPQRNRIYAYADNRPTTFVDPTGAQTEASKVGRTIRDFIVEGLNASAEKANHADSLSFLQLSFQHGAVAQLRQDANQPASANDPGLAQAQAAALHSLADAPFPKALQAKVLAQETGVEDYSMSRLNETVLSVLSKRSFELQTALRGVEQQNYKAYGEVPANPTGDRYVHSFPGLGRPQIAGGLGALDVDPTYTTGFFRVDSPQK